VLAVRHLGDVAVLVAKELLRVVAVPGGAAVKRDRIGACSTDQAARSAVERALEGEEVGSWRAWGTPGGRSPFRHDQPGACQADLPPGNEPRWPESDPVQLVPFAGRCVRITNLREEN
jgi:hypothetical protein